MSKLTLPKCKFCGQEFVPKHPRQTCCKSAECERLRHNKDTAAYMRRKRAEEKSRKEAKR